MSIDYEHEILEEYLSDGFNAKVKNFYNKGAYFIFFLSFHQLKWYIYYGDDMDIELLRLELQKLETEIMVNSYELDKIIKGNKIVFELSK